LLTSKNRGRKRGLRRPGILNKTDGKTIHRMIPYG
jgi:ribosomal protein L35